MEGCEKIHASHVSSQPTSGHGHDHLLPTNLIKRYHNLGMQQLYYRNYIYAVRTTARNSEEKTGGRTRKNAILCHNYQQNSLPKSKKEQQKTIIDMGNRSKNNQRAEQMVDGKGETGEVGGIYATCS